MTTTRTEAEDGTLQVSATYIDDATRERPHLENETEPATRSASVRRACHGRQKGRQEGRQKNGAKKGRQRWRHREEAPKEVDKYPIKEKTHDGYKVQHSWLIPLGDTMWKSKVLGDHLYLCGAGDLMGVEKTQADCAPAACETLALSGG